MKGFIIAIHIFSFHTCVETGYGEPCIGSGGCTEIGQVCANTGKCTCLTENYYSYDGSKCVKELGRVCSTSSECNDAAVICDAGIICKCITVTHYDDNGDGTVGGSCVARHGLGETCTDPSFGTGNDQCSTTNAFCKADTGSNPTTYSCQCGDGSFQDGTSCETERYLDESCSENAHCSLVNNGECRNFECVCQFGFYQTGSGSTGACTKRSLGQTCTEVSQCEAQNVQCTGSGPKICFCKTGYFKVNNNCLQRYLDESCSADSHCSPVNNGVCRNSKCLCQSGYYQSGTGSQGTCTKRYLDQSCAATSQCLAANGECRNSKCLCKTGFYQTGSGFTGTCTKRQLGQTCTTSSQCSSGNAFCTGTCQCQSVYYDTNGSGTGGSCSLRKSLGVACSTPVYNFDQCSDPSGSCIRDSSSSPYKCTCNTGYHQESTGCVGKTLSDPPKNLEITGVRSRGFNISWEEPEEIYNDQNYGYILQIRDDKGICVKETLYRCWDCIGSFKVSNLKGMCSLDVRSEITKSKTELKGKLLYSANLDPDISYNVTVAAVTNTGRGYPAINVERTLEEVPQAPYSVRVTGIGTTSFKVLWKIDGPRPGKTNFTIIVMANSPAPTKECVITGFTTRNYLTEGLEEYWNYSVTVTAATSVGAKTSHKTQQYRTQPAAPGKVLNVKITEALGGIYTLMQISWRAPAILNQNSVIKEYSLVTNSTGATAKKQSLSHESDENYEYKTVVNVIPDETYTFQVYATNIQDMMGAVTTIEKQAPAGVPVNIEDTLKIDVITLYRINNVGERYFTLSLVQDFFEETTNGKVQASGLVACAKDCSFKGIKTLLDFNTMYNWKQASLKGFTLYRVTNPTWLEEINSQCSCARRKRSVTKVEYTVGSDYCTNVSSEEYCNGPLHQGTSYHLVAVSCTNGGCLLSREYGPFVTAAKEPCIIENESSTQSVIIGVVLGLVILILLVYAGYTTFLIRRYRRNDGKEINTARNNDRKSQTYVNESFVVGVADVVGSTNVGTFSNESDTEYSRLDDNTREDRTTYEVIQSSRQY